ncbi:MAG: ABC transporter substrate binding protein [Anaerolineae bacterium]
MRVLHKLVIIGILLGLAFIPVTGASQAQDALRRQVLYINSYHRGYKFSDDITQGIEAVLKAPGSNTDLLVEYMDTKRLASNAYMEELYQLYKIKYGGKKLDLIISSDDAALNFLFTYADELFPGVPVVFCGANYFDVTRLAGFERFTGVSELADVQGTLDLALSLHPQTTQIAVVNDTTVTGQRVHEKLVEVEALYPGIAFIYLEDITMAEVRQRVSQLPPDSLVLITIFSRDSAGEFFEYDVFTPLISESSAVPVYGTWDFSLGYGIIGGKLTSGATEGERAAQLAARILSGERPQDIPVVQQPAARYMFDYDQLQHWGISESALPEDSFILNKPFSFFEQYAKLVWIVGISFVVLTVAIGILIFNILRRQRAEVQLTRSLGELQEIRASLEDRVQERTEAFQQRAALLEAAAEVSRVTTEMIDVDVLLPQVVELVRQRFNLYYVGLFLVDETERYAVLRAGTGDPGREMMARGWQFEVGGHSMIGRCVASGQADIQLDVGEAAVHFDNPYLPETRSEMALPLRAGGQTLGAMTVQSDREAFFSPEDITVLQTVADQVANAVRNARLFQQLQESLDAERRAYGELTREAWLAMLQSQSDLGFVSDRRTTVQNVDVWRPEMETALSTGRVVSSSGDVPTLAIPIKVRDQVVGVVDGRKPDGTAWSEEEAGLLQALTEQLSAALEGAQLYRESQSAAVREQLFSQVSERIRQELDLEDVLKTTVDQIQQVLGLERAAIRLVRDVDQDKVTGG